MSAYAAQGDAPAAVARTFCSAEVNHDYPKAVTQTDVVGLGETADDFVRFSQQRDQQLGTVVRCDINGRNYIRQLDPNGAAFDVTVGFSSGSTAVGTISLHRYTAVPSGQIVWAIFDLDSQLHLD
ncbi:MAG TPA: hypothetical protein VGN32_01855 [Ktedonobacterales bacterium]|nr:hypothetical protein [Ktedonobacterales bacterium]